MLQRLALFPIPNRPSLPLDSRSNRISIRCSSSSTSNSPSESLIVPTDGDLRARERRQLRKERRERNAEFSGSWRKEVEERLERRPKKEHSSWREKLNLDNLAKFGPRWWAVRVARVNAEETADRLARALARGFPEMEFKVYFPAVREKKKLKNGSCCEKTKPLFPGCVFLECVLNKEIHDYVRECDGVGGFLGSKVGNTKRQINKPKPVTAEEMDKIFQQVKQEQESFDQAFEREQEQNFDYNVDSGSSKSKNVTSAKGLFEKKSGHSGDVLLAGRDIEYLAPGATVRILSGPFVEFTGRLKDLDYTNKKATVGFTLFGKDSYVDVEFEQISEEINESMLML